MSRKNPCKIIVIGAGVAGLAAARTLVSKGFEVSVLEARARAGGRIYSDRSLGTTVDMGAAWIHGKKGNPIFEICRENAIKTAETDYSKSCLLNDSGKTVNAVMNGLFGLRAGRVLKRLKRIAAEFDRDISVAEAVETLIKQDKMSSPEIAFLNRQLIEFQAMNAAGLEEQSLRALLSEYAGFKGGDGLFPEGYDQVVKTLSRGLKISFGHVVKQVKQEFQKIIIETDRESFKADAAVITLPLGVLKSGSVQFSPALPEQKTRAIQNIPVGSFNKIAMKFSRPFWPLSAPFIELVSANRNFVCQFLNLHYYSKEAVLVACLAAGTALAWEEDSDELTILKITEQLKRLFGKNASAPESYQITRWGKDPFALGAYSVVSPGSGAKDFEALAERFGLLYFAGEACSFEGQGTVHGAYTSGLKAAQEILSGSRV